MIVTLIASCVVSFAIGWGVRYLTLRRRIEDIHDASMGVHDKAQLLNETAKEMVELHTMNASLLLDMVDVLSDHGDLDEMDENRLRMIRSLYSEPQTLH